jgi:peptidyl-tRNA hydrolase, PTH1 family
MALFQRRPTVGENLPLYTLGQHQTVLLVGLGNMGTSYTKTRHNAGFRAVEGFAAAHSAEPWIDKKDLKCRLTTCMVGSIKVYIVQPLTMMNLSGIAVQKTAHFYKIPTEKILVVHDELDVDFGTIRTRMGGGSAGHNGIKSVTEHVGEQYGRIRIGVGPKTPTGIDSADFVLAKFSKEEESRMNDTRSFIT